MFHSILTHLRGNKADTATLTAALQVARLFGSHLDCLHVRPDLAALASRTSGVGLDGEAGAVLEVLEGLKKDSAQAAGRAAETFAAFCGKEGIVRAEAPPLPGKPNAAFRETTGYEVDRLAAESRYHDLVAVKGGYPDAGGLIAAELGQLIVSAGRPVLLAPSVPARPIRTVAVAWKDTPEAARAVTAALPILCKAEKVFILTASEEDEAMSDHQSVVRYLSWYGLNATPHHVTPADRDVYDAVLESARAADADLLVSGAYGHNRLTEFIFGGFTQGLLDDASIPVLLLH